MHDSGPILSQLDRTNIPKHIAIIMDGNGRWAKKNGRPRVFGHRHGVKSVRTVTEAAAQIGVDYLTLYAFSTENWNRPSSEVTALMLLLVETVKGEIRDLNKNGIKLSAIGDLSRLPDRTRKALENGIADTQNNDRLTLNLALNYSAKWEMREAIKSIAGKIKTGELAPEAISDELISNHLTTAHIPDPELLIRTSGEHRVSNFLLWQIAYAEFYFTDTLWPDFGKEDFYRAILAYQQRERRFGKTSEQLT